jgi:signal transduction histidine kinase
MFGAERSVELPLVNSATVSGSSGPDVHRQPQQDDLRSRRQAAEPLGDELAIRRLRQICHDARQELAVIAALIDRVLSAQQLSVDQEDDLLAVRRVTSELAAAMRETAVGDAVSAPTDISAILRTVAIQSAVVDGARITVAVDDRLTLNCSATQARRVVRNLIENARRAAGPDGWVELRATRVAGELLIEVEDSGSGFGSAPPGLASIGLSVVHDWLATAGGRLRIDDGPGHGALVQLWFPLTSSGSDPLPQRVR